MGTAVLPDVGFDIWEVFSSEDDSLVGTVLQDLRVQHTVNLDVTLYQSTSVPLRSCHDDDITDLESRTVWSSEHARRLQARGSWEDVIEVIGKAARYRFRIDQAAEDSVIHLVVEMLAC